jgi:YHS domain-containing protein
MAKDPLCGMDVETTFSAIHATHQGKTYYFCSEGCKRTFESDRAHYALA